MATSTLLASFYFICGAAIIFLAVLIMRFSSREVSTWSTALVMLFAGIGPILGAIGVIIQRNLPEGTYLFENVIENAAFYSPPGSLVRVDCRQVGQGAARQVECVVRDSGPGVAPEDLPRVFEPFYSKRSGGSGLGLAVAHRIVKEHDGTITVENAPEGGAVVTITLPA